MNFNKLIGIVFMLSIAGMVACSGAAQKPQGQTSQVKGPESSSIFIIGKIEYQQSEGGYFIRGDQPYGRIFKIANPNSEILEPLLKKGDKHVNIEGFLTPGTNILTIEKIYGEKYSGEKSPAPK